VANKEQVMSRLHSGLSVIGALIGLIIAAPRAVGADNKKEGPTAEQIAQWVQDLGSDDFEARQNASKKLWEAGQAAETALRGALKSSDAEVIRRSREILDKFDWGIYPNTPPKIADLIDDYRTGRQDETLNAVALRGLLDEGAAGCAALRKVLAAESHAERRSHIVADLAFNGGRALVALKAPADFAALEELLDAALAIDAKTILPSYAAFLESRGRLKEKIESFKDKPAVKPSCSIEDLLAYLYRVQGDLAQARKYAEKSDDEDLLNRILFVQGDWKELATRDIGLPAQPNTESEKNHYRAAYLRLAGDVEKSKEMLDDMEKAVDLAKNNDEPDEALCELSRALFANGRAEAGLRAISACSAPANVTRSYYIFRQQLRPGEGLKLLEKSPAKTEGFIEAQRHQLGDDEPAIQLLKAANPQQYHELLTQDRSGSLAKLAIEHAPKLTIQMLDDDPESLLRSLFPATQHHSIWWAYLRDRYADQEAMGVLKRLNKLLEGKAGKDLDDWLDDLARQTGDRAEAEREPYYLAMADACRLAGKSEKQQQFLEKACALASVTGQALLELADLYAEKKDWNKAAVRYEQAWLKDHNPLPLFLRGWSLAQSGKEMEGKKLMETAHWMPLGDAKVRNFFAGELGPRGFLDDAYRECALALRYGAVSDYQSAMAIWHLTSQGVANGDYFKAADFRQRLALLAMHHAVYNNAASTCFSAAVQVHGFRARGLLEQGKIDEAMQEMRTCLSADPSGLQVVDLMLRRLMKLGHKKEADELFDKVAEAMRKHLKEFPKDPLILNNYAWLCALGGRNVDDALKHSALAVELAPDNANYYDTYAELCFQKGDQKKALELMRQCVEKDPRQPYFRDQLKRIEKGDPEADLPRTQWRK
jgi:tetratricopeptide (TPR) repeat protein